ncbi:MAG: hypothetical protein KDC97_08470 [Confluentibacter sp.]|nr:hypothetical protein [Confluentibacter sp.]HMQ42896.1 hypothetical protein [Mariniflexile sp.]HMR15793.1 hypothetical protein [Mariniflexile sp.]
MKLKFLGIVWVLLFFVSCKKKQDDAALVVEKPVESQVIKVKDIAKIKYTDYILDSRAEDSIVNWMAYKQLDEVVNNLKKADLSFFKANEKNVKELVRNLKQTIPAEINNNAITARITALETQLLKLESLYNLSTTTKPELLENIRAFLVAFSNLNLQMNKKIEADNIIIERP